MSRLVLFPLRLYNTVCSPLLKHLLGVQAMCRYSPSCSEYTRQQIKKHGMIQGGYLGIKRLLTCHPFAKPIYEE